MTNYNADLSLWKPVFIPRPGHVMCGGQVDIGTGFSQQYFSFHLVSIILLKLHTPFIHSLPMLHNLNNL